jgi:hypothetical protein
METKEVIVTLVCAVFASSGFWACLQLVISNFQKKAERKRNNLSADHQLLIGIAHDRIYALCQEYLARGYITISEYDNLMYIYRPYRDAGGNGTGSKLIESVCELPMKTKEENDE